MVLPLKRRVSPGRDRNCERLTSSGDREGKNTAQGEKGGIGFDFYGGAPGGRETSPVEETIDFSQVEKSEIPKIFDRVLQMVSQNEGEKEVVIQLKPESLGSIVIQCEKITIE